MNVKSKELVKLWRQLNFSINANINNNDENTKKLYHLINDYVFDINHSVNYLKKSMRIQLNELVILSNSLQEEVRLLRLVPVDSLIQILSRYVRDLAYDLKKEVELEIHGDNVRMDKMVLDGLKNPLIHIIRNAIDHGIENPDIRKTLGKSRIGHIELNIVEEGNQIGITITDDGSGIDINKISKYIEENKLATADEIKLMSEHEILEFIFQPGFSTKSMITNISGRGVGLDVVNANLLELKGNVSVTTKLGQSTTFTLSVPLTLSSERGLLVSSGEELFIIPTHSVKRVLVVYPSDIINVEGNQALLIDGHPVVLRALSDILKISDNELINKDKLPIVVVESGWESVAVIVDKIINEREIVIKPLQAPLSNVHCVSGGTLLEYNQVGIVLNSKDLVQTALNNTITHRVTIHDAVKEKQIRPHILVVDDSITTRTLEKNILESRNYQVTISVNGKEAWDLLQKQKFSLVITDVAMPIMDGFTLTEKVKKSEKFRDVPVIIVTSLDSDTEKIRGIEVGANAYIVKSEFESGVLLDVVEQLVTI